MQDVYGGLHHLQKRSRFDAPLVVARSNVRDTALTTTTAYGQLAFKAVLSWESERSVHVSLVYKVTNPKLAELSSLGLVNPLEIVWETTRYSFVVDWFLPIGPWLSALTADVGLSFVTGSQTKRSRLTAGSYSIDRSLFNQSYWLEGGEPSGPSYSGYSMNIIRSCFGSTPVPGLYVKNPLSLRHVLNGLALLVQAFK